MHGSPDQPVLIYLPGLHGNWSLVGGFRKALGNRLCFVEMTYPPTVNWALQDYAAAVEQGLGERVGRWGFASIAEAVGSAL